MVPLPPTIAIGPCPCGPVSPGSLHLPYLKLGNVAALQLDQNVTVLGFPYEGGERVHAALILDCVMQKSGDDHILRHRKTHMPALAHHERSDSQQVTHIRHGRSLAIVNVHLAGVVDGASETIGEVEKIS